MRHSIRGGLSAIVSGVLICLVAPYPATAGSTGDGDRPAEPARWVDLTGKAGPSAAAGERDSRVVVERSSAQRLDLGIELPGFGLEPSELPDGKTYTRVVVPDAAFVEAGQPAVPAFGRWILIPNGTRAELEIEPGKPVVVGDLDVGPAQPRRGQPLDAPVPPFARDEAVFGRDQDSPGVFARLEATKIMRGQQCTVLWIYPFQYNPVKRTLSAYPDLEVTVRFQGEVEPVPARLRDRGFEATQRQLAVNAGPVLDAQAAVGASAQESAPKAGQRQTGWDYIIFSRLEFGAAGELLADWKRKIGFRPFHLSYSAEPSETALQNLLQDWYDNNDIPPRYVLIIGDSDDIPCFYETEHPWTGAPQGDIGTDLYYGLLDGNDMAADVALGRMPVDSVGQALAWVERIIAYEKDPPVVTNFYDRAAIAAQFQDWIPTPDGYEDSRFVQTAEDIAIFLSEYAYGVQKTVTRIYDADPAVTPTYWSSGSLQQLPGFGGGPAGDPNDPIPSYLLRSEGFAWDGDSSDITGALEPDGGSSGSFLVLHRDHGSRQWWSHPFFYPIDISNLDITYGESPVVWSINCQTGWFDNETDFQAGMIIDPNGITGEDEESFAEFFANYCNQGGPVGLIAATRVTDTIYNDRLAWGFMDAIWTWFLYQPFETAPNYRMGDVLNSGKAYMTANVPNDSWRWTHQEAYHWFGDPSMEIRTEHPDWLTVTHPSVWPHQGVAHDLVVHVENFSGPVEDALVTLSHPDHFYEHWKAWTNASGDATFSGLVTGEAGTYDLVATASNNVPWMGTMTSAGADLIFFDGFESGNTSAW